MHMRDNDKEWVKLNYSIVKDDEVLLDSLRDCHVEEIKFSLDIILLGLIYWGLMLWGAISQHSVWYSILTIPGLGMLIIGVSHFVSRAHCWINPRFEEFKYLDEIADYDARKIRWRTEKLIPADESIEDILALTDFYIDGQLNSSRRMFRCVDVTANGLAAYLAGNTFALILMQSAESLSRLIMGIID